MFEFLVYAFLFCIGIAVGSFLNVIILRFGFSESSQARSHCMACAKQIPPYDLIPVLSFFLLKGRCRSCGSALSVQYPIVELSMGALFVLSYLTVPPVLAFWSIVSFVALLVFIATFVALVVYDFRHTLVPMPFIYFLFGAAGVATTANSLFTQSWQPLLDGLLSAVALGGFFALVHLITRGRGMGLGDAFVACAIGLLLGLVRGVEAIMFAVWGGTIIYLLIMLVTYLVRPLGLFRAGRGVTITAELPFVPFLALGCLLAIFTDISPLQGVTWLVNTLWNAQQL